MENRSHHLGHARLVLIGLELENEDDGANEGEYLYMCA